MFHGCSLTLAYGFQPLCGCFGSLVIAVILLKIIAQNLFP